MNDPRTFFGLLAMSFAAVITLAWWVTRRIDQPGLWVRLVEYFVADDAAFTADVLGRHAAAQDIPRSGHGTQGEPAAPSVGSVHETAGPGEPEWDDPDPDETLTWMHQLPRWDENDHEADTLHGTEILPVVNDGPPPGAKVLLPVKGDWVPVTYEPPVDVTTDLPRPGCGSSAAPYVDEAYSRAGLSGPGQPYPHAGPAPWRAATPNPRIPCRQQPPDWLDDLFTLLPDWYQRPALEAA
jgi:hypothetical protein